MLCTFARVLASKAAQNGGFRCGTTSRSKSGSEMGRRIRLCEALQDPQMYDRTNAF
jgi:hypothetical protein